MERLSLSFQMYKFVVCIHSIFCNYHHYLNFVYYYPRSQKESPYLKQSPFSTGLPILLLYLNPVFGMSPFTQGGSFPGSSMLWCQPLLLSFSDQLIFCCVSAAQFAYQSSTNENLSCSYPLAIVHNAISRLHTQVICRSVFISSRSSLGLVFAVFLAFWGTVKLFIEGAELLYLQHQSAEKPWLYPCWHFCH